MPEQKYWDRLFDVSRVLAQLHIDDRVNHAAEVGCGYGTFTVPVAHSITGVLHSYDIDPEMIKATRARAAASGIKNLRLLERDIVADGFDLKPKSVDAVLLFNILHCEDPVQMLCAAAEVTRKCGRVLAIHWRTDVPTPRGPSLAIRPRPQQIAAWASSVGLEPDAPQLILPWHYGIVLRRP